METAAHNQSPLAPPSRLSSSLLPASAVAAIALSAWLCAAGQYLNAALVAAAALAFGFALASGASIETVLIAWFVATPFASFFVRFPVERSVITFDRAVIACVLLLLVVKFKPPLLVTRFEIVWALLAALALASAALKSLDTAYAAKIAVDSFCLPLVAFHVARHHFDTRYRSRALTLGAIALAFMLFAAGAFELLAGENLFRYKGSELVREGELRVNGPFASDSSFAIICLLLTIFLMMTPRILGVRFDRGARITHALALALVAVAALLPLFRAVAAALPLAAGLAIILSRPKPGDRSRGSSLSYPLKRLASRRVAWLAAAGVALTLAVAAWIVLGSSPVGRLASLRNAYGRLATWEAAAKIALEKPALGVGLANYTDYFRDKYFGGRRERESVLRTRAIDSPHSNPLWIASELGLIGFALYAAANVYIFMMGYRALRRAASASRRAAAACYLAIAAAYWVPGLTLTSGAYSDLNLYFFFLLGLLLNLSRGGGERPQFAQLETA
jgi:O-antigen ligase